VKNQTNKTAKLLRESGYDAQVLDESLYGASVLATKDGAAAVLVLDGAADDGQWERRQNLLRSLAEEELTAELVTEDGLAWDSNNPEQWVSDLLEQLEV
jgi:hypothetical protein